jgi:hypothetical protein
MAFAEKQKWHLVVRDDARKTVFEEQVETTLGEVQQLAADTAKTFTADFVVAVWPWTADGYGPEVVRIAGCKPTKYDELNRAQRKLYDQVDQIAGAQAADCRDVLIAQDALARDKAAVAEAFGGAGAGAEFRREHTSKRGTCRICYQAGHYLDGIRDPYWVHDHRLGNHVFQPNDAHTRLVFEQTGSRGWRPRSI